jgi:hypothetical protein
MGGKPSDGLDPLSMYYQPKPRPSVRPKGWKREWSCSFGLIIFLTLHSSFTAHVQRTYLRPNFYKPLFVDLNKNMCHRSSFFYRGPKDNQIWSNVLSFPPNSLHGLPYKWVFFGFFCSCSHIRVLSLSTGLAGSLHL